MDDNGLFLKPFPINELNFNVRRDSKSANFASIASNSEYSMSTTARVAAPQAVVLIKNHLSIRHLRSAALLASQARRMESDVTGPVEWTPASQDRWDECAALADACVFTAVSGLDAAINELYINACTDNVHDGLSAPLRAQLAALWSQGKGDGKGIGNRKEFPEILYKYDRALNCADAVNGALLVRPSIDDAMLLIETRNALTHAREKFQPAAPQGPPELWSDLERRLRARVAPCVLTPTSAMYLWCRVLGAPLAEWAFITAHEYASAAYEALGATNIFASERNRLA